MINTLIYLHAYYKLTVELLKDSLLNELFKTITCGNRIDNFLRVIVCIVSELNIEKVWLVGFW